MCTVSFVPAREGFRMMSNRDERRDRAVALDPAIARLGSRSAIMPVDPAGGGSWVGVNDAGLVAVVLNRHDGPLVPTRSFTSRGLLVRRALEHESIAAAIAAVRALGAHGFQPFRLMLAQEKRLAMVAGNSREIADAEAALDRPRMFTASSLGDVLVDAPRRQLFDCLMHHVEDRRDGQRRFHRHQWTDKPDISVLMTRDDAATVSRTVVEISGHGIALEYEPLVPCGPPRRLALQPC